MLLGVADSDRALFGSTSRIISERLHEIIGTLPDKIDATRR